jgi:hypothetical protein
MPKYVCAREYLCAVFLCTPPSGRVMNGHQRGAKQIPGRAGISTGYVYVNASENAKHAATSQEMSFN